MSGAGPDTPSERELFSKRASVVGVCAIILAVWLVIFALLNWLIDEPWRLFGYGVVASVLVGWMAAMSPQLSVVTRRVGEGIDVEWKILFLGRKVARKEIASVASLHAKQQGGPFSGGDDTWLLWAETEVGTKKEVIGGSLPLLFWLKKPELDRICETFNQKRSNGESCAEVGSTRT